MAFIGFAAIAIGVPINGWVLSILWSWFLVPLGVPAVNTAHAIGIATIASLLCHQPRKTPDDQAEAIGEIIGYYFFVPLFSLIMGAILKAFL